ncbi:HEAT repeat protein [Anaeromyxobacter sp. PSR-1]|nr:HEAT repeat protein [Anaeromyxobacter sp. PSR-1]
MRVAAERRAREAVPALVERLRDPEPEVAHLAVGALGQLRDPRAVGPLIDLSQRGDGGMALALVRIIGDIGGPEAEGYLLTLEAGHPEPRVRAAARDALAELRAREAEAGRVAGK